MSEIFSVIVLGAIEGITEFLPVSSTGHLLIAEHWLGRQSDMFNVVIQAGAMLAVTIVYWSRLMALAAGLHRPENRLYALKLSLSFLITAVLGLTAKKAGFALPETVTPVAWALLTGGVWIFAAEYWASRQDDVAAVTWPAVIAVGVAQIVAAIFPGTSRSGATIFAAMVAGTTDRSAATEFAFLVGIPTMFAASASELYGQFGANLAAEDWSRLAIAFITATIVAFVSIKWLLGYIRLNTFMAFA